MEFWQQLISSIPFRTTMKQLLRRQRRDYNGYWVISRVNGLFREPVNSFCQSKSCKDLRSTTYQKKCNLPSHTMCCGEFADTLPERNHWFCSALESEETLVFPTSKKMSHRLLSSLEQWVLGLGCSRNGAIGYSLLWTQKSRWYRLPPVMEQLTTLFSGSRRIVERDCLPETEQLATSTLESGKTLCFTACWK